MKSKSFVWEKGTWNKPLTSFKNTDKTFLMVFGNDLVKIQEIIKEYKNYNIIGCTTAGNISHGQFFNVSKEKPTVTLTYFEFDKTTVKIATEKIESYSDSKDAGKRLLKQFKKESNLSGSICFTEGLVVNGAQFAAGIDEENENKTPVIGGLAADDITFTQTLVFSNNGLELNSAIAIGFYGDEFKMIMQSKSGVESFGIERKITKSDKNVLYEIDGQPALDIYEDFLGVKSNELPASGLNFPVEISENFEKKEGLVRTPIAIDRDLKTITFTGEIPEGGYVRLMTASRESLSMAAEEVGSMCIESVPLKQKESKEYFNLLITCAARRLVLASDVEDELLPTYELTESSQDNSVGFYSYGEIISLNNECCLANQTMSQCVFFED
jgi:hypothetical protein